MKYIILVFLTFCLIVIVSFTQKLNVFSKENVFDKRNSFEIKSNTNVNCSDGWRITGYFTPIETDFDSKAQMREIEVKNVGKFSFNQDFLKTVFNEDEGWGEGWGKTRFGWYLGNYNGAWHKSDDPLDSNNSPLKVNSVAVDNSLIPYDSTVTIPGLPDKLNEKSFIANDVGVTVHGKHIDIYTGEGKDAEKEMYRVTFEDEDQLQRVCFQTPE